MIQLGLTPNGRPRLEVGTAHVVWYKYSGYGGDHLKARFVVFFDRSGRRERQLFGDDFGSALNFARSVA